MLIARKIYFSGNNSSFTNCKGFRIPLCTHVCVHSAADSLTLKRQNVVTHESRLFPSPEEGQAVWCFIKWTETMSVIKKLNIYRGIKYTEDKIFHVI